MFASFALLMIVQAAAPAQADPPQSAPVRTATAPSPTDVVVKGRTPRRQRSVDMGDPNRVICREMGVTGSRLGRQKMCATAAQWAEDRRQNQSVIEKSQARKWSSSQ